MILHLRKVKFCAVECRWAHTSGYRRALQIGFTLECLIRCIYCLEAMQKTPQTPRILVQNAQGGTAPSPGPLSPPILAQEPNRVLIH